MQAPPEALAAAEASHRDGKQKYLGAWFHEESAGLAYDLASLRFRGPGEAILNNDLTMFSAELAEVDQLTKEEVVSGLRSQAKASSSLLAEGPAFSDLDLLISDVIQAGQSRLLGYFQSEADAAAAVQTDLAQRAAGLAGDGSPASLPGAASAPCLPTFGGPMALPRINTAPNPLDHTQLVGAGAAGPGMQRTPTSVMDFAALAEQAFPQKREYPAEDEEGEEPHPGAKRARLSGVEGTECLMALHPVPSLEEWLAGVVV